MHLIDAIRMAAQQSRESKQPAAEQQTQEAVVSGTQPTEKEVSMSQTQSPPAPPPQAAMGIDLDTPRPVDPAVTANAGSVVRLELFLSPEQMHQLLRSILQGAHSVMTLREASQFLRIKNETLVQMAEEGQIPAFLVEGRWKFPRQALEEWVTLRAVSRKAKDSEVNKDVA
jgi:excisionase family DNA binding protein